MKFLLFILFLISQLTIYGQLNSIGLTNGISFSTVNSKSFLTDISFKYGYSGGLEYIHTFRNRIQMKTGVIYTQKGFRTVYYSSDNMGNPINYGAKSSYNYNYLSVPLNIGYHYGDSFFGEISIGISFDGLVNSNSRIILGNDVILNNSTKKVRPFDISPNISLGQGFRFKNDLSIILYTEFSHGIIQLNNENYFSGSNILNKNFILRLSLLKPIKRKTNKNNTN